MPGQRNQTQTKNLKKSPVTVFAIVKKYEFSPEYRLTFLIIQNRPNNYAANSTEYHFNTADN